MQTYPGASVRSTGLGMENTDADGWSIDFLSGLTNARGVLPAFRPVSPHSLHPFDPPPILGLRAHSVPPLTRPRDTPCRDARAADRRRVLSTALGSMAVMLGVAAMRPIAVSAKGEVSGR